MLAVVEPVLMVWSVPLSTLAVWSWPFTPNATLLVLLVVVLKKPSWVSVVVLPLTPLLMPLAARAICSLFPLRVSEICSPAALVQCANSASHPVAVLALLLTTKYDLAVLPVGSCEGVATE